MEISKLQAKSAFSLLQQIVFKNASNKWALTRNIKRLKPIVEEIEDVWEDKRLDLCQKDRDQCPILDDAGKKKFSVENEKKFRKEIRTFMQESVEFEPYKFRSNTEIENIKEMFMNSDVEFLLDEAMLQEPSHIAATENVN